MKPNYSPNEWASLVAEDVFRGRAGRAVCTSTYVPLPSIPMFVNTTTPRKAPKPACAPMQRAFLGLRETYIEQLDVPRHDALRLMAEGLEKWGQGLLMKQLTMLLDDLEIPHNKSALRTLGAFSAEGSQPEACVATVALECTLSRNRTAPLVKYVTGFGTALTGVDVAAHVAWAVDPERCGPREVAHLLCNPQTYVSLMQLGGDAWRVNGQGMPPRFRGAAIIMDVGVPDNAVIEVYNPATIMLDHMNMVPMPYHCALQPLEL